MALKIVKSSGEETANALANITHNASIADPALSAEINYDIDQLDAFLDVILHAGTVDGEELPFWITPIRIPTVGYPRIEQAFFRTVTPNFKRPIRAYFGTSTLRPTEKGLRNKGSHIVTTRCVVLDDIGTKVPRERITLAPTYIIESSEGNFQYGYVFKTPIDRPTAAAELVNLLYTEGLSDAGGKMANKLVRLPCGVNGKAEKPPEETLFMVRLAELHPERLYEPQELLDGLGVEAEWDVIYADAEAYARATADKGAGASLWSGAEMPSMSGVIDQALEFIIETGEFISDSGEFVTVKCPNAHMHTTGDDAAGYRPVGRGDQPHTRAFKCFHDHCSTYTTADYLQYLAAQGCAELPVSDPAAMLTSEWVFDAFSNRVWRVRNCRKPTPFSLDAFRTLYPKKVSVVGADGKTKMVAQHTLWYMSPSRVNIFGERFDPSTESRMLETEDGLMINSYNPPRWGDGEIEPYHVDRFTAFLEYLIPAETEREYFLDWLACKVKDMGFRGAAIVMVALQQGTGRSTLADMLATLLGEENRVNMPFNKLIGEGEFNEWQTYPLIVTDETLNTGNNDFYQVYERLKDLIDFRPKLTTINPKYGRKYQTNVHSSSIFFSNHSGALALSKEDRRFYIISNAMQRQSPEYFTELNAWLGQKSVSGRPAWAPSVWRWLKKRNVCVTKMLAPVSDTAGKAAMMHSTVSPIGAVTDAVISALKARGVHTYSTKVLTNLIETYANRADFIETKNWKRVVKRYIAEASLPTELKPTKVDGKAVRVCLFHSAIQERPALLSAARNEGQTRKDNAWMRENYAQFLAALTDTEFFAAVDSNLVAYDI